MHDLRGKTLLVGWCRVLHKKLPIVGEIDHHLPVQLMIYKAGGGTALCLLSYMPLVTNTGSVDFSSCCRVNYRGSSS